MGGAIGGGQGGHGPSNNLVGGAILYLPPPPQYFALEFKILALDLMQREENMFRVDKHFGPDLPLLFKMDEIW